MKKQICSEEQQTATQGMATQRSKPLLIPTTDFNCQALPGLLSQHSKW
ncbi:MAG: hypothetical protein AB8F74_11830 [Saprospiraceae bacterium]